MGYVKGHTKRTKSGKVSVVKGHWKKHPGNNSRQISWGSTEEDATSGDFVTITNRFQKTPYGKKWKVYAESNYQTVKNTKNNMTKEKALVVARAYMKNPKRKKRK